jgi:hypothetical protein
MSEKITNLTTESFKSIVNAAKTPVLVEFLGAVVRAVQGDRARPRGARHGARRQADHRQGQHRRP